VLLRAFAVFGLSCSIATQVQSQVREGDCGFDRWSVKTMRDPDSKLIRRSPVLSSISDLSRIPIPQRAYPLNGRIAPQELSVYRVRGIVDRISVEDDQDWHIVLRDPEHPMVTMIVEIPDPRCVEDLGVRALLTEARQALHSIPRKGVAEFEGVGFFDFIHTQWGGTRNGFELHPVLAIRSSSKSLGSSSANKK
jgi:hypothetical protein